MQDDLTALGKLILALACKSLHAVQEDNIQNSIALVSRHYSKDLSNVILYVNYLNINKYINNFGVIII